MTWPSDVTRTEVDGVPTLLTPSTDGHFLAGLSFRVGHADETLPTAGITHLIEHLALHPVVPHEQSNGMTSYCWTHFVVAGDEAEVATRLSAAAAALTRLPLHRLEHEKRVLLTEGASRPGDPLSIYRYGAAGFGLVAYPELGLHRVTADEVADWARTNFTRQNAILWVAGDRIPTGLRLDLPDGRPRPFPRAVSLLPRTPAWIPGRGPIRLHAVVPRATEANLFSQVLGSTLFAELRERSGLSYHAGAEYVPRDADHALIVAHADYLPERQEAAVGAFIDALAALEWGNAGELRLEDHRRMMRRGLEIPDLTARRLPQLAADILTGRPVDSTEELQSQLDAVTPDTLRQIAASVRASALVQSPLDLDWAGLEQAPEWAPTPITGWRHAALDDSGLAIVRTPHAVALEWPQGRQAVVRFDAASAVKSYPDGALGVIGLDGTQVPLEPTLFDLPPAVLADLARQFAPATIVHMPPRDPGDIPRPAAPAEPAKRKRGFWRR